MKVLLFVQTGDARPKVFTRYAANYSGLFSRNVEFARQHPDANMSKPLRACAAADRWWLVECENAEAGRRCIEWSLASHGFVSAVVQSSEQSPARILASGGKECAR